MMNTGVVPDANVGLNSGQWFAASSLRLNGVLPSYVSQFDKNRYYTSTTGVRAFPYASVRAGGATHFDNAGRLVWAPSNIFAYSDDLTQASWTKTDSSISTDGTLTPSGLTASLVTEGTAGTALVQQQPAAMPTHVYYAYSIEVKRGNTDWLRLFAGAGGNDVRAWFNLNTGAIGTAQVNGVAVSPRAPEMVALGNGWYRCTIFAGSLNAAGPAFLSVSATADAATSRVNNATRYIGRQQLEFYGVDSPKLPMIPTASTSYYGPRFDHNPSGLAPRGLLVEEARTNSIPNSWGVGAAIGTTPPSNWAFVTGSGITVSITGIGYEDGMPYMDVQFSGTAAAGVTVSLQFNASTSVAALVAQQWAGSVYVRRAPGASNDGRNYFIGLLQRDGGGAALAAIGTTSIEAGLGAASLRLNRAQVVGTLADAATAFVCLRITKAYLASDVANDTIRVSLPQLEGTTVGYATSAIPTFNASATRSADAIEEAIASWLDQTQGTLYTDFILPSMTTGLFPNVSAIDDGSTNNRVQQYASTNATAAFGGMRVDVGGVNQVNTSTGNTVNFLTVTKYATSYVLNNVRAVQNGGAVQQDTSSTIPGASTHVRIGKTSTAANTARWIREFRYYPTGGASDAQLQTLTT